MKVLAAIILAFYLSVIKAANFDLHNQLTPVHGLFVRPSEDGVTGDLYVAASEDNDVNSQWLAEHPINFLPSTQTQAASVPIKYTKSLTSTISPNEETITTQKRAVIKSNPIKYAYALPVPGPADASAFNPYAFGFYGANIPKSEKTKCQSQDPLPYPYPYFYPHMMTALTTAMNNLREDEDDTKSRQPFPHQWPGAYTYPYQYIMLDPTTWSQCRTTTPEKENTEEE
ncbi:uncharacterized protein [Battus philenor]|uniref:uncharacterized protein n=1 Tax=Battus philenor TaxID=42288 RepID=UPI0035CF2199